MNIAITGARGFLARYLINELIENGHAVVLLSRQQGELYGREVYETDYSIQSLTKILNADIDGIAHLASTRANYDNICLYDDLINETSNLYYVARQLGINNIVFTSSISVYSGNELPYKEDIVPVPKNNYGKYKLLCENIGEKQNEMGMCIKNLRLAHIYGAHEDNNYMINVFFRNAISHTALSVNCISLAKREMLYAKDAARGIRLALEHDKVKGTFNIGSNEYLTTLDIANIVASAVTPKLPIKQGTEIETFSSSYMLSDKANEFFNYSPQYSLSRALQEIII